MAKEARSGLSPTQERIDRAKRTTEEAMAIIDIERDATRKKTARLRKLRLAKEAEAPPVKKKSVPKKPKKAAKKKK